MVVEMETDRERIRWAKYPQRYKESARKTRTGIQVLVENSY